MTAVAAVATIATITSAPPHSALEATTPSTTTPYVVFCHATSRLDKRWPITSWVALGRTLNTQGYRVLLTS
ncbi:MAG: hypothetical protein HC784_15515, partial [Hydrococcus sp. CSU_1_8]|nr:hypothetical protein [Hydrococcus sp. CSU_1_8]